VLECVVNVSEGRDRAAVDAIAAAGGDCLLDVHSDPHHHRSVLTFAGDDQALDRAVRDVTREALHRIDLRAHTGVHPRLGAVDVVPFVPLDGSTMGDAVAARDRFAQWAADELGLPCFLYGPPPARSLPDVRRQAFRPLLPDTGPSLPHPTGGAVCVGARPVLVAYNLWLADGTPVDVARAVAAQLRSPAVRALGLDVGGRPQASLNLVAPLDVGPAAAHDAAVALGAPVVATELVGLLPRAVLDTIPPERWHHLDVGPARTIEARVAAVAARPKRRSPGAGPATAGGEGAGAPAR
jgi:glutamate formiminotransferase